MPLVDASRRSGAIERGIQAVDVALALVDEAVDPARAAHLFCERARLKNQGSGGGRDDLRHALELLPAEKMLAAIDPGDLPYRRNDNFSAAITYEDGSLAHLLYTALGPRSGLGKERIEVFCDGEAEPLGDGQAPWSGFA